MSKFDEEVLAELREIRDLIDAQGRRVLPDLQTFAFNCNVQGANTVVEGTPGLRIFVCGLLMDSAGTVTATWGTGDGKTFTPFPGFASTGNPGDLSLTAQTMVHLALNFPNFVFRTEQGRPLMLNLSGAVAVGGYLTYWKA